MIGNTKSTGNAAELVAKKHLQSRGLVFVCSNYQCRMGEIDLVFRDNSTLVFVEVKFRKNEHFGKPCEMVNRNKQRKMIRTAQFYLQQHSLTESVVARFDVIGITAAPSSHKNKEPQIQWLRNAFEATGY